MQREFEEHMLSAYLDDELSADERALVEQRLQEDSAARELLEDLKRVRSMVHGLPVWTGSPVSFDIAQLTKKPIEPASTTGDQTQLSLDDEEEPRQPHSSNERKRLVDNGRTLPWTWLSGPAGRTLLTLAASILVLAALVPMWWPSRSPESIAFQAPAMGRKSVESEVKGSFGGGGLEQDSARGIDSAMLSSGMSGAENFGATGKEGKDAPTAAGGMAGMGGASLQLQPHPLPAADGLARSTIPPPGAIAAPADFDSSLAKQAPPVPAPAAAPKNMPSDPSARSAEASPSREGLQALGNSLAEQAKLPEARKPGESETLKSMASDKSPVVGHSPATDAKALESTVVYAEPAVFFAYSKAWSDEEVRNMLPRVIGMTPAASQTNRVLLERTESGINPEPGADATMQTRLQAAGMAGETPSGPASVALATLPGNAAANTWFTEINKVEPLTELRGDASNLFALGPGKSVEPGMAEVTNAIADNRNQDNALPPPASVQPEISSKPKSNNVPPPTSVPEGRTEQQMMDGAARNLELKRQGAVPQYRNGSLVLFVTEAEASKILQQIQTQESRTRFALGSQAAQYGADPTTPSLPRVWRVEPRGGSLGMGGAGAPAAPSPAARDMAPSDMAARGMGAPDMAARGMGAPGMGAPGMAGPGMAGPGMAGPGMAAAGSAAAGSATRGTAAGGSAVASTEASSTEAAAAVPAASTPGPQDKVILILNQPPAQ